MSSITAILDPESDGSVRLPVPQQLRGLKVKMEARLEAAEASSRRARAGLWKALPGHFRMTVDFDAPLEVFREYME